LPVFSLNHSPYHVLAAVVV